MGDVCDTDKDGDCVMDDDDNCFLIHNPNQIDTDQDGKGDVCEDDFDGDGVDDGLDNCPNNGLIFNTDFRDSQEFNLVGGSDPYISTWERFPLHPLQGDGGDFFIIEPYLTTFVTVVQKTH